MTKIYRVAIEGMYGLDKEQFFDDRHLAEIAYDALIKEKKKDGDTLKDDDESEKNFSEYKTHISQENIRLLKGVHWQYGRMESYGENGSEWADYTEQLILEEIDIQKN